MCTETYLLLFVLFVFFFNDTATTEIYTLSLHDALPISFKDIDRFQNRSKFSTWLYGIALNMCRKHLRDKGRHATSASQSVLDAQPARSRGVLSSVIRHEMAERLEVSVARLPTPMREAFLLRYVDNMDYPEISSITGASEGTSRVRAFRARALLREELGSVVDTVWLEKD